MFLIIVFGDWNVVDEFYYEVWVVVFCCVCVEYFGDVWMVY